MCVDAEPLPLSSSVVDIVVVVVMGVVLPPAGVVLVVNNVVSCCRVAVCRIVVRTGRGVISGLLVGGGVGLVVVAEGVNDMEFDDNRTKKFSKSATMLTLKTNYFWKLFVSINTLDFPHI